MNYPGYENSYLESAFEFLDLASVKKMLSHTSLVIERRLNHLRLQEQKDLLASEKALYAERDAKEILAESKTMKELLDQAGQVARTESTVLILGETGTGKELLARRIHAESRRAEAPFVIVDSTTIPENLLESELFGHERGAFTGADRQKIGRVELAHQGSLFLDEVGELPISAQVKLLRVLQEKTFNRVGGNRTIKSDFRLIAATSRNLSVEVAAGRFREDLYYRLNVIPLHLPPLRERGEDILKLAVYYLKHYAIKYRQAITDLTPDQRRALVLYRWPGNIRELKNVLERGVLLSREGRLELDLPSETVVNEEHPFAGSPSLEEVQRRYIRDVLRRTGGRIAGPGGAAEILGIKRTSLYARMRTLGMTRKDGR